MTQQSAIATINAEYSQAKIQLDTDEVLAKQGLVADLLLKISRVKVQDLANRVKVEQQRLAISGRATKAQINAQQSRLLQLRALAKLKKDQVDALKVRAGTGGVLQVVAVQEGQQVAPGVNIARVADPASLKAELKIAETQIKDVRVGQPVAVDTRNGIIQGRVSRIDPAAREGTFVVDAELTGPLPGSARPDLSVDGTIELERLTNVLYVGRPAFGQAQQTVGMFRLSPDGQEATRVQVALGRSSVSTIEVLSGLKEGDKVILSDTSTLDSYKVIRVR
jgi:HlyD family secretion protein